MSPFQILVRDDFREDFREDSKVYLIEPQVIRLVQHEHGSLRR